MPVDFQCEQCYEKISAKEALVGRRVLCPMCDTILAVPTKGAARPVLEHDLSESIPRFKLTEWDRAYAARALEIGKVKPDRLRQAIRSLRRAQRSGKGASLNESLLQSHFIAEADDRAVQQSIRGAAAEGGQRFTECPNCFATIPASSGTRQCSYCGQLLGEIHVMDMCPNCKAEQHMGKKLCNSCGADMSTGIMPNQPVRKCPRCGTAIRGELRSCPLCDTAMHRSVAGVALEEELRRGGRLIKHWLPIAAVLAICIASVWLGLNWEKLVYGKARVSLDKRVAALDDALKYGDLDAIAKVIDPGLKHQATETTRAAILGADQPGERIRSVLEIRHVNFSVGKTNASVYTKTRVSLQPLQQSVRIKTSGDLPAAAEGMGLMSRKRSGNVAWKWIRRSGAWYYRGPLPASAPGGPSSAEQ